MHVRIIVFIIYHVIAVPLFALYVIELLLLKFRREFTSTFYTFFIFGGIIDLLFYTLNVFVYQFAFLPGTAQLFDIFRPTSKNQLWMNYSPLLSIVNMIMFYLPGVQDVINLLIAANRFCALCSPVLYRKIFTRINTLIMIPLALIYSIIFVIPVIGAFGFAISLVPPDNETVPVFMITVNGIPSISMSVYTSAFTFADSGICLALYCVIAAWVFKLKKKSNAAELRMLLLGFSILLTNIPSIAYQLGWKWLMIANSWYDGTNAVLFQTLPWVILIKTLTSPLLLIATNEQMRRELALLLPARIRPVERKSMAFEATTSVISVAPAVRAH